MKMRAVAQGRVFAFPAKGQYASERTDAGHQQ